MLNLLVRDARQLRDFYRIFRPVLAGADGLCFSLAAFAATQVICQSYAVVICHPSRGKLKMFSSKQEIIEQTGFSASSLKRFRLSGSWIEGIHWVRVGTRKTLYNRELVLDWIVNQNNPTAHQRAIETYLANLPSNRSARRGRKAS